MGTHGSTHLTLATGGCYKSQQVTAVISAELSGHGEAPLTWAWAVPLPAAQGGMASEIWTAAPWE